MSVSFDAKNHKNRVSVQWLKGLWGVGGQTFSLTNSLVRNFNYTSYIFKYNDVYTCCDQNVDCESSSSTTAKHVHGPQVLSVSTHVKTTINTRLASLQTALIHAACTVAKCCAHTLSFPERDAAPLKETSNIANCLPRKAPRSVVGDFWRGGLGRVLG